VVGAEQRYSVDGRLVDEAECRALFASAELPDRMRRTAALIDGRDVIDVGCYAGSFLAHLAQEDPGRDLLGIDYDEDNLQIARMLHPDLRFQSSSVYELAVPDEAADCVTFQEVIEHLANPGEALAELNRVLRPGGSLIITTPNAYYWRHFREFVVAEASARLRRRPPRLTATVFDEASDWNRHVQAWTPGTLLALVESFGFRYETHEYALDAVTRAEQALIRAVPFIGPVIVLKVRKAA
jgi:2-polyprenyl-3-methyl-5-hydroxy-6-metoxy-1,4-benzoquinol methylase